MVIHCIFFFFFSSRRRHTRLQGDWSSDVCSSDLWNAGVAGSSANRMIVRHRVSFIFPLPTADRAEIERVPGVTTVSWANWFGGVYGPDPNDFKNFWPRMAVDPETWFK